MKLDNPKFTAFALDELDPIERAEIEALLEQHPEALDEINKTIEVSSLLRNVLQNEHAEGFTGEQREAILNNTAVLSEIESMSDVSLQRDAASIVVVSSPGWEKHLVMQAIAACLMVAVGLYSLYSGLGRKRDVIPVAKLSQPLPAPAMMPETRPGEIVVNLFGDEEITLKPVVANEVPTEAALVDDLAPEAVAVRHDLSPIIDETKQRPLVPEIAIDSKPSFTAPAPAPLAPQPLQIAKQTPNPDAKQKQLRILPAAAARKLITSIPSHDPTIKAGDGKLDALATPVKVVSNPGEVPVEAIAKYAIQPSLIQKGLLTREVSQFVRVADAPLSLTEVNFNPVRFADLKSRLSRESKNLPTISELTNSFHYTQPYPDDGQPFGMTLEVASCPWQPRHRLVLVVVQTSETSSGALETARKVGFQVDFNPLEAVAYRLLGQDSVQSVANTSSGVPRPNTTVTALYEVIPAEQPVPEESFQQSKYLPWNKLARKVAGRLPSSVQQELLTATLQYQSGGDKSRHTIEKALVDEGKSWADASASFRWAASVAAFGMVLHQSSNVESLDIGVIQKMADEALEGQQDRSEFLTILQALLGR